MKKKTLKKILKWADKAALPCPHESEIQQRAYRYIEIESIRQYLIDLYIQELIS